MNDNCSEIRLWNGCNATTDRQTAARTLTGIRPCLSVFLSIFVSPFLFVAIFHQSPLAARVLPPLLLTTLAHLDAASSKARRTWNLKLKLKLQLKLTKMKMDTVASASFFSCLPFKFNFEINHISSTNN